MFLAIGLPMMLVMSDRGPGYGDEKAFHIFVVERFISQFPAPSLADYECTVTPLYHLVVAGVAKVFGGDIGVMRLAGSAFSVALLMVLAYWIARRLGPLVGVLLTAPLMLCVSYLAPATAIRPDNAGWLFVGLVLLLCFRKRLDWKFYALAALSTSLLVLTRQNHLWACSLVWAAAWLSPAVSPACGRERTLRGAFAWLAAPTPARVRHMGLALLATVPAFLIVAGFYKLWGGLVPPMMQTCDDVPISAGHAAHSVKVLGVNFTTHVLLLAFIGLYGTALLGYLWPTVRRVVRLERVPVLVVAGSTLLAGVLAAIPHTDMNVDAQRVGDVWSVAGALPVVAHRSLLLIALAMAGGAVIGVFALSLGRRHAVLALVCLAAFTAAHMVNYSAWQRYIEPMVLLMLPVFTVLAVVHLTQTRMSGRERAAFPPRWAHVGAVLLIGGLVLVSVSKYMTKEERSAIMTMVAR
jgi:hypothetical protein